MDPRRPRHGAEMRPDPLGQEVLAVLERVDPVVACEVLGRHALGWAVWRPRVHQGRAAVVRISRVVDPLAPELPPRIRCSTEAFDPLAALTGPCLLARTRPALGTVPRVRGDPGDRSFKKLCQHVAPPDRRLEREVELDKNAGPRRRNASEGELLAVPAHRSDAACAGPRESRPTARQRLTRLRPPVL